MNVLAASFIVALIGVSAFIVVAVFTSRGRIGLLPPIAVRDSSNSSQVPIDLPESAKKFRVLGWMLVLLFYLTAIFCLLQGLSDVRILLHWDQWANYFGSQLSDQSEIVLYSKFWIAIAIALAFMGFWAQIRLRRRST
jgi:hypothetical protein